MESKRNQPTGDALAPGGTSGAHQADSAPTIGSARADGESNDSRSDAKYTKSLSTIAGMPLDELAAPAVTYRSDGAWKAAVRSDRTFDARGTLVWTDRSSSLETRMPAAFRGTLLDGNAIAYVSTVTDGQVKGCGAPAKAISLQVPAAW